MSQNKKLYIESINNLIFNYVSKPVNYYLDAGGGDGIRASAISKKINAKHTVLIDRSQSMIDLVKSKNFKYVSRIKIADFKYNQKFNLITCLWNVMGHIDSRKERLASLVNLRKLLSEDGLLIIDVNNRYNFNYGLVNVFKNIIKDIFPYNSKKKGWFRFEHREKFFPVYLHSPFEILRDLKHIGFKDFKTFTVDYNNGKIYRNLFFGQLLIIAKTRKN